MTRKPPGAGEAHFAHAAGAAHHVAVGGIGCDLIHDGAPILVRQPDTLGRREVGEGLDDAVQRIGYDVLCVIDAK